MSARNIFIINKASGYGAVELENLKAELNKLALDKNIGIHFNLQSYQDEILKQLTIKDFFSISDNFDTLETDNLFSTNDSYEAIRHLNLKVNELKLMEEEFLIKKYSFLNDIRDVAFNCFPDSDSLDFYVSNQYCIELTDYEHIIVKNKDLAKAFVDSFKPTKKENYFGLKTLKFELKK